MLSRRDLLAVLGLSALVGPVPGFAAPSHVEGTGALEFGPPLDFSFERLVALARDMRARPYAAPVDPAPDVLARIGYEQHLAIRQPARNGLFAEPGQDGVVTGFHLGELFRRPVKLNRVEMGVSRELLYRHGSFSYPKGSPAAEMPDNAGFAGFRVHEPRDAEGHEPGDWLAFLGASYFRSSGDLKQYGISARGLALDTAHPGGGREEFPDFTEFWLEAMVGGVMRIHALLQGPSVTGAFRFDVRHHPEVTMDVTCRLFLRGDVARFGLAPLTSMYWYSQANRWTGGDWRPEVHDSDGLRIERADGSVHWRALGNPPDVSVTAFRLGKVRGFGLMQRDRNFDHYQDAAAFERRPNLWVEPLEGFDDGEVQLVELPTEAEYGDNIVAFFVPAAPAKAGSDFGCRYRLAWSGREPESGLARMVDLRVGLPRLNRGAAGGARHERKVIADFSDIAFRSAGDGDLEPSVRLTRGEAFRPHLARLAPNGLWRVEFDLFSTGREPVDVAVELRLNGRLVSETSGFRIWPQEGPV